MAAETITGWDYLLAAAACCAPICLAFGGPIAERVVNSIANPFQGSQRPPMSLPSGHAARVQLLQALITLDSLDW
jgi:hypothetical protein